MIDVYGIKNVLEKLEINPGDTIFIHSDARILAQFTDPQTKIDFNNFFLNIIDYIGNIGNIIFPTFTYSATKSEIFDIKKTKSCVGLLSNKFLELKGVYRTAHPIFSFGILGNEKKNFETNNYSCFGLNSQFAILDKLSTKFICLGAPINNSITYMHYIEELCKVPYRKYINFNGKIIRNNKLFDVNCEYFARKLELKINTLPALNLFIKYVNKLSNSSNINVFKYSKFDVFSISTKVFNEFAIPLLKKYPYLFIQEGEKLYKDINLNLNDD